MRGVEGREGEGEMGVGSCYDRIFLCAQIGALCLGLNLFAAEPGGTTGEPLSNGTETTGSEPVGSYDLNDLHRDPNDPNDLNDPHGGRIPSRLPRLQHPTDQTIPPTTENNPGHTTTGGVTNSDQILPDPYGRTTGTDSGNGIDSIVDGIPIVVLKNPSNSIEATTPLPPSLRTNHIDAVLQVTQNFVTTLASETVQANGKIFSLKIKVANALSNGLYSSERVTEIENLLTDLVTQQSHLESVLRSISDSIQDIDEAYAHLLIGNSALTERVDTLHVEQQQALASMRSIVTLVRQTYESLAYSLVSLQQNILADEFMYKIAAGTFDPKKDYKWFDPIEKKGAIRQTEVLGSLIEDMEGIARNVVVADEVDDELECFFLALKVGKLQGKLRELKRAFDVYRDKKIVDNPSFEDALTTIKEELEEIGHERGALANCPFVAQQKITLDKALQNLLTDIAAISGKKE